MAFCVMPDHVHFAFCLLPEGDLSAVVASFSKHTASRLNRGALRSGRFWQEGFYDRRCRNAEELADASAYIEHNPVRSGFVENARDWPFSSAHVS